MRGQRGQDVLEQEELTINGRWAVRIERIVRVPTLGEEKGAYYHYFIELEPNRVVQLITPQKDMTVGVSEDSTQEIMTKEDYPANKAVVDQMARTFTLSP